MTDPTADAGGPFEWDWFNDHTRPHGGSYGVKHADGTVVCFTNSHKDGYEKAVELAAAMNEKFRIALEPRAQNDSSGADR